MHSNYINLTTHKFKKETMEDKEEKKVMVVGFISGSLGDNTVKNPMPDGYISESGLPEELVQQMVENGWTDKYGNVCFAEDFNPYPVKGEDGHVYLALNNKSVGEPIGKELMMTAANLLFESESLSN